MLPNRVLFILLPTSNLALPKCLLHTAANLLSEVRLWSCHHANNSTICPLRPQYGVEILVEQTRHSSPASTCLSPLCYDPPSAFYAPAIHVGCPPSSLLTLCHEYTFYPNLGSLSGRFLLLLQGSVQTWPLGSISAPISLS